MNKDAELLVSRGLACNIRAFQRATRAMETYCRASELAPVISPEDAKRLLTQLAHNIEAVGKCLANYEHRRRR